MAATAHFRAVRQDGMADSGLLAAAPANHPHVRDADSRFFLHSPALAVLRRAVTHGPPRCSSPATAAFPRLPSSTCLPGVIPFCSGVRPAPSPACMPVSPPTDMMHVSSPTPELSATSTQIRILIIWPHPCLSYEPDSF